MINTPDFVPLILLGLKILMMITFGIYLFFSVIFLQKIRLLSRIIETKVSSWVALCAFSNLILTLLFLLASIFVI